MLPNMGGRRCGLEDRVQEPAQPESCPTPPPKRGCSVDGRKNGRIAGDLSACTSGFQTRLAMCASAFILQES